MITAQQPSSRHLVDPQLAPALALFPPFELSDATLPVLRAMSLSNEMTDAPQEGVQVARFSVHGEPGAPPVSVSLLRPQHVTTPIPSILHIHGGGFVSGCAADAEKQLKTLARDAECCIVSVDYRLAPETPYPGALDDCYAALRWMYSRATELNIDVQRVGVYGDSAGGGLAAALALLARDRGEYHLAFQHLLYPMLDDRTCVTASPHPFTGEYIWTRDNNRFGWRSYLGKPAGSPGTSEYAAPARAQHLEGLPPTYIGTGALDLFLDEDLDYALRLTRAGVAIELHVYPGAYHSFDLVSEARVSHQAASDSISALKRFLYG